MDGLFQDIGSMWVLSLTVDLRRYVIFAIAVWVVLWLVLRNPLRARKIRGETPPRGQLMTEFLFSVRSIAVFSTASVGINLLERAGAYPMSEMAQSWGPWWLAASVVLMIIGQDAWIYAMHVGCTGRAGSARSIAAITRATILRPSPPTASTWARRC